MFSPNKDINTYIVKSDRIVVSKNSVPMRTIKINRGQISLLPSFPSSKENGIVCRLGTVRRFRLWFLSR